MIFLKIISEIKEQRPIERLQLYSMGEKLTQRLHYAQLGANMHRCNLENKFELCAAKQAYTQKHYAFMKVNFKGYTVLGATETTETNDNDCVPRSSGCESGLISIDVLKDAKQKLIVRCREPAVQSAQRRK